MSPIAIRDKGYCTFSHYTWDLPVCSFEYTPAIYIKPLHRLYMPHLKFLTVYANVEGKINFLSSKHCGNVGTCSLSLCFIHLIPGIYWGLWMIHKWNFIQIRSIFRKTYICRFPCNKKKYLIKKKKVHGSYCVCQECWLGTRFPNKHRPSIEVTVFNHRWLANS